MQRDDTELPSGEEMRHRIEQMEELLSTLPTELIESPASIWATEVAPLAKAECVAAMSLGLVRPQFMPNIGWLMQTAYKRGYLVGKASALRFVVAEEPAGAEEGQSGSANSL